MSTIWSRICNWHLANKISIVVFRVFAWTDFQSLHFSFIDSVFDFFRSFVRVCWSDKFHWKKTSHRSCNNFNMHGHISFVYIFISNNIPLKLLRFIKALRPPAKNGPSRQIVLPNNLTRLQINVFSCSRWGLVYTSLF